MEIVRGCKTCKWNFHGKCADEGEFGYGAKVSSSCVKERSCWVIGLDYFIELCEMLPEDIRNVYLNDMHFDDLMPLLRKIEGI